MKFQVAVASAVVGAFVAGAAITSEAKGGPEDTTSIVDLAVAVNGQSGEFSTLIAALTKTGLAGVLDGKGQYTVFAPTDAAFAAAGLDADVIAAMDPDELVVLADILLDHVAHGRLLAADVVEKSKIRTVSKNFLVVTVDESGVTVGGAPVSGVDNEASNGVVHIIDAVILL